MKEQKQHLENIISQQKTLIEEIENLNKEITIKRENAFKLQGIIEYLNAVIKESESEEKKLNQNENMKDSLSKENTLE